MNRQSLDRKSNSKDVSIKKYLLNYTSEGKKYTLKTREKERGRPTAKFEQLLGSISSKRFLALFVLGESLKTHVHLYVFKQLVHVSQCYVKVYLNFF